MRMWNIDTGRMCRKHLLGEHVEMHMFVGTLNKNKSIDGYLKNKLIEVHNIKKRHNQLVKEMRKRGYKHFSELPDYKIKKQGIVDSKKNYKELIKRCKECRRLS